MKRLLVAVACAAALGACTRSSSEARPASLTPVDMSNHPPIDRLPDPELNGGHAGRAPRRITVDQLGKSIEIAAGRPWTQLANRASSLGKADFALTVSENTDPNLVFAKFLDDGARDVCLATARADLNIAAPEGRVLWPQLPGNSRDFTLAQDGAIDDNLTYLSTRFWGQPFGAEELVEWRSSFKAMALRAKTVNRPEQAWGAICIAMMTDSRFITY